MKELFTLKKIEQQGTGLRPIKCSNQMDSISRECLRDNVEMFRYRNAISIPPLGMIDDLAAVAKCGPESVILNSVINAKINLKRLEFNQSKCIKLHINKEDRKQYGVGGDDLNPRNVRCVLLKVQEKEMKSGSKEKYVGDIISSNGSNDANIARRRSLGMGAISQIFGILNEVSLGYHYIEIGLILRESILMSKMLLSAESWHKIYQHQVEKLDEIDRIFFKKLFNSHSKTGAEFYFSETGSIPIKIKISVKRLVYWWHILHVDKSEMIRKVYTAQKLSPVSGDWIEMLETDKKLFHIDLIDEEVEKITKQKCKAFVRRKAEELTKEYLKNLQRKHSKSRNLEIDELSVSPYLLDSRFTKEDRELLFKLRSRTVWVKANFSLVTSVQSSRTSTQGFDQGFGPELLK